MKSFWSITLLVLILLPWRATAQKTIDTDEQAWFGAFSQIRLNQRWGLWFDAHLRLRDQYVNTLGQLLIRPGLTFYLYDDVRLTAAYAYVHQFPAEGHANIGRPEHRPWQQIQWFNRYAWLRFTNAIRLEERFRRKLKSDNELGEGYLFNYRIRFNTTAFVPLTRKGFEPGGLQLVLNNELMVNFGDEIVYNYFDQNRFFAGLAYQLTPQAQLHGGYMNLYQQLPAGNAFRNQHTIRIFYFHNFDLRKER
ncbi:MAG: DUF2490 domain-containing protein [Saprospiraceae bacterium]|nr:DUF2490 domain-containing protein [Saprospiraceae bacterium]